MPRCARGRKAVEEAAAAGPALGSLADRFGALANQLPRLWSVLLFDEAALLADYAARLFLALPRPSSAA